MSKDGSSKENIEQKVQRLEREIKKLYGVLEVSTAVISTLDLDQLLSNIMNIAKTVIGSEASSLLLVDEVTGNLSCEVALGEKSEAIQEKFFLEKGKGIAGWVAEKGKPLLVRDVSQEKRFFAGVDKATGFKTRSILCVPMRVHDKIIGVLEAMNPVEGEFFDQSDLDVFYAFANIASIAIANARLAHEMIEKKALEKELSIAKEIQQKFLKSQFPASKNFNTFVQNFSAREIGGDFYDFYQRASGCLELTIGDVCGRGIPAALYMIEALNELRALQQMHQSTSEIISKLNDHLVEKTTFGTFVTLCYVQFWPQSGKLQIINAGHLPLWIVNFDKNSVRSVSGQTALPLGIKQSVQYNCEEDQLSPGDYLFMFTDGLIEIRNKNQEPFDFQGLEKSVLRKRKSRSAQSMVHSVLSDLKEFCEGDIQQDDITLLALEYIGKE